MHVHRLRVSLSRTLRILSESKVSPRPGKGKAAGIDAGGGHGGVKSRTREPARRRGQTGVRASVAGASHPAAPRGTPRPPSQRAGQAAQAYREGIRSALEVRTDPVWLKFPLLAKLEVPDLNPLAGHPDTHMVRYAFRAQANRLAILSRTENISSAVASRPGSPRAVLVSFT